MVGLVGGMARANWGRISGLLLLVLCAGCAQGPVVGQSERAGASEVGDAPISSEIGDPTAAPSSAATPSPAPVADPPPQEDPPPREGSIRYEVDQSLQNFRNEYAFPPASEAVHGVDHYYNDPAYEFSTILMNYWDGKSEKIEFSTDPTVPSPCPMKEGPFEAEAWFETFDFLPVSKTHILIDPPGAGPQKIEGSARQCFEHSTRGAVLAAAHLQFQMPYVVGYSDNANQNRVIYSKTRQVFKEINFITSPNFNPDDLPGEYEFVSVTGYRINRYDESGVRLDIFNYYPLKSGDGIVTQVPITVVWEKGDWRVGIIEDEFVIDEHPEGFILFSAFAGSSDEEV